MNIDKLMM